MYTRARFDKLPPAGQGLVFIGLSFPLFIPFAIAGDLPRGTLAWIFSSALLSASYAISVKRTDKSIAISIAMLIPFHVALMVFNPLRRVHLLGGLVMPILIVDYCMDYAFLWLITRMFKPSCL